MVSKDEKADAKQHKRWLALKKPAWLPTDDLPALPDEPEDTQAWDARIQSCCQAFQANWSDMQHASRQAGVSYRECELSPERWEFPVIAVADLHIDENKFANN